MLKGFNCYECRRQYDEANRPDAVPCDDGGLDACPYTKRACGSPGDDSEKGCGLAPENESVVSFYPRWRVLGEAAFQLLDIKFEDEVEADEFVNKLMLIHQAYPQLEHAINSSRQEAKSESEGRKQSTRRQSPRKV